MQNDLKERPWRSSLIPVRKWFESLLPVNPGKGKWRQVRRTVSGRPGCAMLRVIPVLSLIILLCSPAIAAQKFVIEWGWDVPTGPITSSRGVTT